MSAEELKAHRSVLPCAALVLGVAAVALKLVLSATTHGTNDVATFLRFLREYRGSGAVLLYEKEFYFTHPPFVIRFLEGVGWLAKTTGLSWPFCLRLPAILADLGSVFLLGRILAPELAQETGTRSARAAISLVAAAPASILISGFHGNTDPVMIFFTLLSLAWIGRQDRVWLAGAAMGMSVNIKVVPLMFWPAIFFWLPSWRRRAEYFAAAILVVVVASSPVIFQAPGLVAHKVLGYSGGYGMWGLSRFAKSLPSLAEISALFKAHGKWVLAAGLLLLSYGMNRRTGKPPLYRQLGVIAFAFLAFTPGFSVQYLAWLVPWLVGLPLLASAPFLAASGAFLLLVYTFWCQEHAQAIRNSNWLDPEFWRRGFPWDFANADRAPLWRGSIVPVEIACWLTVVALFVLRLRTLRDPPDEAPAPARR
jgi:hypothetical protein